MSDFSFSHVSTYVALILVCQEVAIYSPVVGSADSKSGNVFPRSCALPCVYVLNSAMALDQGRQYSDAHGDIWLGCAGFGGQ